MNLENKAMLMGPAVAFVIGCGGAQLAPKALLDARDDTARARDGLAMQLDPTDVHEAQVALDRAEQAWQNSPGDPKSVDLAIVADRRALLAQSQAAIIKARQDEQQATAARDELRAAQLRSARGQLTQTQQVLGATQMQLREQESAAGAQQQRMRELETKLKDARDTIAKIATVKDDARGTVITLQSELLFTTAKWDLKPAAMAKLDQIAEALKGQEQAVVVYGFTDSVGTRENNIVLSQNRAQSVRDYLVSKGLPPDLVTTRGEGPDEPVADNTSIEGRAQNRRVEIVVKPKN